MSIVRLKSHSFTTCAVCTLCFYEKKKAPKKQLSGQSNTSKAKREHKVLSLDEKIKILDHLKSGMSPAKVDW